MKTFLDDEFMLGGEFSKKLYRNYAQKMPIFDFHCHLDPKDIAEDRRFRNLTELWLSGDHYKWRLMRACGVEEEYITGGADPYQKFLKWAGTVPNCVGNPLYHWTHLELQRFFGIQELLNPETAPQIWEKANSLLAAPEFSARGILRRFHVRAVCTTDDPLSGLRWHARFAKGETGVLMLPTFRPDKALHVENEGFREYVGEMEKVCGTRIDSPETLAKALEGRAEFFRSMGCRGADQSFSSPDFTVRDPEAAREAFREGMEGRRPSKRGTDAFQTELMTALGRVYRRLGFVMQLHLGVIRNNSARMFRLTGPDTGFDSVGDGVSAASLSALLDGLDRTDELPKTVLYTLNDNDNAKLESLAGCFQGGPDGAKVQFGAAWWFHDSRDGMLNQMRTLANMGLLGSFIGMLTDSRSFASYPRHEYFRRILCGLLGGWAENGEAPADERLLGDMVQNICYRNAARYFGIES